MDITSANAKLLLKVDLLFPNGIFLQKWGTDQALQADEETFGEVQFSIDGKLSAGYTPTAKVVTVTLAADSPSIPSFDRWISMQRVLKRMLTCQMVVTLPAVSKVINYINGVLTSGVAVPNIQKVLNPHTYKITFEDRNMQTI